MVMKEADYADRIILALRAKYQSKQEESKPLSEDLMIGPNRITLHREMLFEGKCSIMLPETLREMEYLDSMVKYRNQNRPKIIKTDINRDATITFDLLPITDREESADVTVKMDEIRDNMKKVWKQNVFYDKGEVQANGLAVAWMDFRAFCIDGSLYSMLFMFQAGGQIVLGNFHCSFPKYDIWKPAILKILTTIQVSE